MSIGQRIRTLREALGLTQIELAEAVGVSKGAVSQWETGVIKSVAGDSLLKLAKTLGTTPDCLLQGEINPSVLLADEERVLNLYRSLSTRNKEIALRLLKAL